MGVQIGGVGVFDTRNPGGGHYKARIDRMPADAFDHGCRECSPAMALANGGRTAEGHTSLRFGDRGSGMPPITVTLNGEDVSNLADEACTNEHGEGWVVMLHGPDPHACPWHHGGIVTDEENPDRPPEYMPCMRLVRGRVSITVLHRGAT